MTDAPELKPCPFCGGGARIYQDPSHSTAWFCGCEDWDCFGNMMWDETKTGATDKWNRRADLSSPLGAVVKPLLWEPWHLGVSQANTPWGLYHTWDGHWRAQDMSWGRPSTDPQAAAQSDYTSRILAALELPTHAALLAHAMRLPEVAAVRDAGNAVVARWDSPDWKSGHTLDHITRLRATLAALVAKP